MPGKLTRKEIQQDQIRGVLEEIYFWLTQNSTYLAAAVGVIALIAIGGYGWRVYQEGVTLDRQARLAEALKIFHAPLQGEEETPEPGHEGHDHGPAESEYRFVGAQERNQRALEEFSSLAQSGPNSRTGQIARYYEALTLSRLQRNDEAASALEGLIADLTDPELANLARNQLALVLEAQGKTEGAIEQWQAILDADALNFPRDQLLALLGKASERLGRKAEALGYYRQLVAEFPAAPQTRMLERRIDYLSAFVPPDTFASEPPDSEGDEESS